MSDWEIQYPDTMRNIMIPKLFFGEEAAEAEWARAEKPLDTFIHTESFKEFKRKEVLFLFGRRGTGKTSIMQMMKFEVNNKQIKEYSHCWMISDEDVFHELSINIRTSPLAQLPQKELNYILKRKWRWILTIMAMRAVVDSSKIVPEELSVVVKYLNDQNIGANPVVNIIRLIEDELMNIDYDITKMGGAIIKITRKMLSADYDQASKALASYLIKTNGKCLVLVDSIEEYDLKDDISRAVVTALIGATVEIYNSSSNNKVYCKVAFPSEIYPHFKSFNREKVEGKNLFLLWQYGDLVSLMAKRYKHLLTMEESKPGRQIPPDLVESNGDLEDHSVAKKYIYNFLPKLIKTKSDIEFDTLAYIIRHTQKKPRQVIQIFNIICTLGENHKKGIFEIDSDLIVCGVHARIDLLVEGALDMYDKVYPRASSIIKKVMLGANSYFDYASLDQRLTKVKDLRDQADLSREEVRRLLFESGVLGLKGKEHNFSNSNKSLWEGLFEYQIKGTITFTPDTECLVHPMFYRDFQIKVNMNKFIYPIPQEDEEKELLGKAGIKLA